MPEMRRKFDREFREGAVRIVRENGKSVAEVGTVSRAVFLARHAGLGSGGMGTVSDDIGRCESTQE